MRFRRSRPDPDPPDPNSTGPVPAPDQDEPVGDERVEGDHRRRRGPWDSSEVGEDESAARVDLGSLLVTARPGVELRLQVDEASGQVIAVLLVEKGGAVELRPFAAPRNADIWDGIRRQLAAEATRRGATATEVDGVYGTELHVLASVTTPDGKPATQPSRVLGIAGPRWLLRATYFGKPALEPDPDGVIESAARDVVVVRGGDPMPPGDPLPMRMPPNAETGPPPA